MHKPKKDGQGKSKRRARGEGTVIGRGDGRYVARIPLGGGRRKEEYYETRQEAERAKRRMLNERDSGKLVTERDQTVEEYLHYWLDAHRVTIRETTYSMYYGYVSYRLVPALGHVKLQKLTVEMIQALYQQWEHELSPNTIHLIHSILSEALKDAVKWKRLAFNPAQDVKLPKKRKPKVYAFSEEDVVRLLQCAQRLRLYALFRMALLLGMRIGELLGLQWSDIDFDRAELKVERTLSYVRDPTTGAYRFIMGPPKTEMGQRVIHLPSDIAEVLRVHRRQQEEMSASVSDWKNMNMVFCTRKGGYLLPHTVRKVFDVLLKDAGLEHMKFHALRHNASLILRRLKIDPVVRKEMLGHSSLSMTDDVYGHSTLRMHQEAAQEIERLFGDGGV